MIGGPEVLILLYLTIIIVLPMWVYNDAKKNSSDGPVVWALVMFFSGSIALPLYFIIGRDASGRTAPQY